MPANKKVTNTKHTAKNTNMEPPLPQDLKEKIANWKEMFPQYRQSTNDDIIAIFDEYNNDFEAAVYGAMNGLITSKPAGGWQSVGQKKKKKTTAQKGQTTNQKSHRTAPTSDTSNRGRKSANRGQSSNRGASNRQKDSRPRNTNPPKSTPKSSSNPPPVNSTPAQSWTNEKDIPWTNESWTNPTESSTTTAWTSDANTSDWKSEATPQPKQNSASVANVTPHTSNPTPTQQVIQKQSQQPVQNSTVQNTGERLSYANVARSRQAWNPNNKPAQIAKKENVQLPNEPTTQVADTKLTPQQAPQTSSAPVSVPSNAPVSVPSQTFSQQPTSSTPLQKAPQAESNIAPQPSTSPATVSKPEKPRVGVLLPASNYEGVAFQFGNLGLRDEDLVASSRPSESPKEQIPAAGQSLSSVNSSQHTSNKPDSANIPKSDSSLVSNQENEVNVMPAPMQGYPQYQVYPTVDSTEHGLRGVPMFFPGETYQPHGYMRPEGKYRGNQSGSPSGGRGEASSSKFSTDQGAQTVPGQPFHYGYPMYSPYQFPGGSYGNQFYGYGFNPKFSYSQNYGNTGMPYALDEESSKQRMSGGPYPPAAGQETNVSGSKQTAGGAKQTSNKSGNAGNQSGPANAPTSGGPTMEGNFGAQDYKHLQGNDLYGEYNSSFMSPPFFHQYQPQPQQPGSRNYN